MRKQFAAIVLAVLVITAQGNAKEIGGVSMPESLKAGQTTLLLNGAGVREKFFIDVYVGGLYLKKRSQDPKEIIEANEPMAIRLHIVSSMLTSKKMEKATREGFKKATGGNIEPIKVQIDEFCSVFKKEIKEDDRYDLIYVPGKGVEVYINGEYTSVTEGLAFKQALFGIWLSDKPAQKSLKKAMLGES
ncbi:MAG: chalcone isomerase [Phycisphaerae bacterium]|nr:chalcone isomerase [Phycisphaerae bacterium]NIX32040.1 chalcone isomerase [Phycisphaerae bacterium]